MVWNKNKIANQKDVSFSGNQSYPTEKKCFKIAWVRLWGSYAMFVNHLMNSQGSPGLHLPIDMVNIPRFCKVFKKTTVSISIGFLITNINCLPRKKIESLFAACRERFPGKFEHSTKKIHGTIPISWYWSFTNPTCWVREPCILTPAGVIPKPEFKPFLERIP